MREEKRPARKRPLRSSDSRPYRKTGESYAQWPPPRLGIYLRELQEKYRPAGLPFSKTPSALADEARRNIFNANHVTLLLCGLRGPWADPHLQDWNLPLIRNQLKRVASRLAESKKVQPEILKHNRRFQSVMNQIRALPFWSKEERESVLTLLARQKIQPVVFRPMRKLGITRHPATPEPGQGFWAPVILQLVSYLARTTREQERALFRMIARILHLASGRRFPDSPSRVKTRWYAWKGLTKNSPPRALG